MRTSNCLESIFHTYSVQGPLLSGYNRANHPAPFHTTYPGMLRHLQQARLLVPAAAGQCVAPGPNRWNELTMLEGGAGKHAGTARDNKQFFKLGKNPMLQAYLGNKTI